ncbi:hypothetical protein [Bradyrhizobium sp.]|uniref:hypothetical protein n=1 Tax=Bradyrhizobium sp. TaxID=376 RepID=UPI003C45FD74
MAAPAGLFAIGGLKCLDHHLRIMEGMRRAMKRIGIWAFYAVSTLAILYLALYAYAALTGNRLQPGDPIHMFRKPDAPSYS